MSELFGRIDKLSPKKKALLAKRLRHRRMAAEEPPIIRRKAPDEYPLSYAQQRVWFLQQWDRTASVYNVSAGLRLRGRLDVGALELAINEVFKRHEILRASYTTDHGAPVQKIVPEISFRLPVFDLEKMGADAAQEAVRRIGADARRPFNLEQAPLLRMSLYRTGPDDQFLSFVMHHIISDGWSVEILINEVAELYSAALRGSDPDLAALPVQYADYAHWQREYLRGDALISQLEYWKRELAGSASLLNLPFDRSRPASVSCRGAHLSFDLPQSILVDLKKLSQQEGATLFMTLLAAFQAFLHRWSQQDDVLVGTPVAGRSRREIEGLIGFFVNTLVLRSDFSHDMTFRELLRNVRKTSLGAFDHQDLPIELLVEEMHPDRNAGISPLFQVMFSLENAAARRLNLPGLSVEPVDFESGTSKFDLLLVMMEGENGLKGTFEYNADLFDRETIARAASRFEILLRAGAASADTKISMLPLMEPEERAQILVEWNRTATAYPRDCDLAALFEAQVDRNPAAEAIWAEGERMTYLDLDRRSNQLARYLRRCGVGCESVVALFMDRSPDMIVAVLAIIKAGGAYLPLDMASPKDRLSYILGESRAAFLLTEHHHLHQLSQTEARVICLEAAAGNIRRESTGRLHTALSPLNLAYVMYTSGSTGAPKGVSIPHRAVTRVVKNTNYIDIDSSDRVAHASNPSFDAATLEIWGALLCGAGLVIVDKNVLLSAAEMSKFLAKHRISALFLTTALFNYLARHAPDMFQGVRYCMTGGEAADPAVFRLVLAHKPPARLINGYGPTESTTFAAAFMAESLSRSASSVPIGRPISNTSLYVLDRYLNPVPVGVPGELYIGGDGLARCYLSSPDLTAEKFIPNPFSEPGAEPGERLYRTGDKVRYLPDGNIDFIGRFDDQVKLSGFRIETGEIQTALLAFPGVRDSLVLLREDAPGEKSIVAYVVPDPGADLSISGLQRFAREKLPEYMIPSAFIKLEALPLSANGKVNRKALPAPDHSRPDLNREYVAPRTRLESCLAAEWQKVLEIEKIGVYDSFFELGGNSLKAAVLANRIQEMLGQTIHVRTVFMAPTIADLAMYMAEYYPEAVARVTGMQEPERAEFEAAGRFAASGSVVTAESLERIRQIIRPLQPRPAEYEKQHSKNPPAVFVLSPPRSGSTLLRAMLAGHSRLFSPPELDLLSFNTLSERRQAFSGRYSFWLEGILRAVMEVKWCSVEEAERLMQRLEQDGVSSQWFYRMLQTWIGDRLLIDKTPVYSLDREILKRAEHDFENPLYVHLVRNPYASIYSFIEAKLDQVFFRYEHPFSQRELAELVWIVSHQNILDFLKDVPACRQIRIVFEDLVSRPRAVMEDLSRFLGIGFQDAMLKPYEGKRMTDGVRPGTQMVGDFKFYLRNRIDPKAAERWKIFEAGDSLSEEAWQVAGLLGYERPANPKAKPDAEEIGRIPSIARDGDLPLSFAQQRLWFLDQWEPGSPLYNVPSAVRITGALDYAVLQRVLNEIVHRHESLRTVFHTVDGRPCQSIRPSLEIPVALSDLSAMERDEQERAADRLIEEESRKPFSLEQGPLLRALLIKMNSAEHIFAFTLHHIVSDGWSIKVLLNEIAALYPAFRLGTPSPLPELPIQYADYSAWQREELKHEKLEKELEFWKKKLAGAPPLLNLPTDKPRGGSSSRRGRRIAFELPEDLSRRVREFSERAGVTTFTTLNAIFVTLIHRYSGQEDICVGTPVAGRDRRELESLIGFFVNTLVLRSDLSGDPSFSELISRTQQMTIDALAHSSLPFEFLVDELHVQRNSSHTPLFQVMFTLQDALLNSVRISDMTLDPVYPDSGTAKFDLLMSLAERKDIYRGSLEYATDLFEEQTIQRMIRHFMILADAALKNADCRISELLVMEEQEKREIISCLNATEAAFDRDSCIHYLFERQAEETPEAEAIVFENSAIAYAQLNERANRLAHYLRMMGAGPETIVGLALERSVDMIVSLFGILKAGAAYVPLDPTYPAERLRNILQDSGARLLVAGNDLPDDAIPGSIHTIRLEVEWPAISSESSKNPPHVNCPENLAYVIYTSGSTGKPKGVMVQHRSVLNLLEGLSLAVYSKLPRRQLAVSLNAPLVFDASVQQWAMLLKGHTIHILPRHVRQDGEALLEFVRKHRLDVFDCVPSQLKVLLEAGLFSEGNWIPRALLPGGEAIDPGLWSILSGFSGTEAFNMYGPTECTVDVTAWPVTLSSKKPVIGRPLANARFYVLDSRLAPVPVGVPGELFIGGACLARGYAGRPDWTGERFIPDPFSGEPGSRLYRTGDRVRYLNDGSLEYLRRADNQVKLRGFRIEPGEIESALRKCERVGEAAVVLRADNSGHRRLMAYLTAAGSVPPDPLDLRNQLMRQLPEYMVPSHFSVLSGMPRTPAGKIDRQQLLQIDPAQPVTNASYAAPAGREEETLARIWAQVLGVERVGREDNFFELGGDSILSIQVVSRARQAGLQITPKLLFEHPTVAALAAAAGGACLGAAEQGPVTGPVPLTPIQSWFVEQEMLCPDYFNQSVLLESKHPISSEALKKAVTAVFAHHDALRLRLEKQGSAWMQINAGLEPDLPLTRIDLSAVPEHEIEARIESCARDIQGSLNLSCGPLARVAHFHLGPQCSSRLLIAIHHLAIDGISWRILLEDFQNAYEDAISGRDIRLPSKTASFQFWAGRMKDVSEADFVKQEVKYWLRLAEKEIRPLRVESTGGENNISSIEQVRLEFGPEETRRLVYEVPRRLKADLNSMLLTALTRAYCQWSGDRALFVDVEGNGREGLVSNVDVSRTVGWFTAMYPVLLESAPGAGFEGSLNVIRDQLQQIPHGGAGFGVLKYLCPDRELREKIRALPSPQISFNYLGRYDTLFSEESRFTPAGESIGPESHPQNRRSHLLDISGRVMNGHLEMTWLYSRNRMGRESIEQLAGMFAEELRSIGSCVSLPASSDGSAVPDLSEAGLSDKEFESLMEEVGEAL